MPALGRTNRINLFTSVDRGDYIVRLEWLSFSRQQQGKIAHLKIE